METVPAEALRNTNSDILQVMILSAGDVREFRSDRSVVRQMMPWLLGVGLVAAGVLVVGVAVSSAAVSVWAALLVVVCLVVAAVAVSSIATVTVRDGLVDLRRWTGRHVVLGMDDLQALHAPFMSGLKGSSAPSLLVLRRRGRGRRIMLTQGVWERDVLVELASAVGADTATGVMEARDWQRRAPGLLPWPRRHPWLTILGGVVVVIMVFVVVFSLAG
jgi:hypothetical protein|nr:hypothetical protein [Aeromicrobium sp.]